ncbi:MAG: hypothetical protein RIQ84_949 [Pseudomonadota bacterium]|jgi:hypothetical protein
MKICEILTLQERINLSRLMPRYKPKAKKQKPKAAKAPKWPKVPAAPKKHVAPRPIVKAPPKPFDSPKSVRKSIGPKQTKPLDDRSNLEPNSFLKPLPQNVISPRDAVDRDLEKKLSFGRSIADHNGFDGRLSNRSFDSKSRSN